MSKGDEVGDPMSHAHEDAPLILTDTELIQETLVVLMTQLLTLCMTW